jgi:TatD DNase family protein
MIDIHCHLEQKDFDADRDEVINECAKQMKALISSSPYLPNFEDALKTHRRYWNFVFISLAIHPTYVEETGERDLGNACEFIKKNRNEITAIGECGLDYFHVKDKKLQEKQKKMFETFIKLAQELDKPLIIHCRDAFDDCIEILEKHCMKGARVVFHLFSSRKHLQKIIENGWSISIGPGISKSKELKKIARDCPLGRIMLETDAPWFGFGKRQTPLGVKIPLEAIAKLKSRPYADIERQTDLNAERFFNLE